MTAQTPAEAVSLLRTRLPFRITSIFRPEGTHAYGAFDAAPRFKPRMGLAAADVHGCDSPEMIGLAAWLGDRLAPHLQAFLERDHFHIHDLRRLPRPILRVLPYGRAFVEITPRCLLHRGCRAAPGAPRHFERVA